MNSIPKSALAIRHPYILVIIALLWYSIVLIYGLAYPLNPNRIVETWFFALLIHRYCPRLRRGIMWLSALLIVFYHPTAALYGRPSFGIVASLIGTNTAEAGEYLRAIPAKTYVTGILLAAMIILTDYAVNKVKAPVYRHSWITACILLLTIGIMTHSTARKGYTIGGFPLRIQPIEFIADGYLMPRAYFAELNKLHADLRRPDSWQITQTRQRYRNYVLIVGESARADYLHLYGFKYSDTPFLDKYANIVMQDMLSAGPNTAISLLHGLTLNQGTTFTMQNNIITLANKAGMDTVWLSNQGALGQYDTAISAIAHKAHHVHFLKTTGYDFGMQTYDDELLPWLKKNLQQPLPAKQNRLIVLHLIGSHPNPCDRLRRKPHHYVANQNSNCYIDSIRQTDDNLAAIYRLLTQTRQPFSMLYFSDHGLSHDKNTFEKHSITLSSSILRHNDHYYQNYHIPLVVINSGGHQQIRNHAKRSGLQLLDGLASWLGIDTPQLPYGKLFFQNTDSPQRQVLTMNKQLRPASQLADDPLPPDLQ